MEPVGWDISTQNKGYYLFTIPRKRFALKPDIVMRHEERVVVLDTKWKQLINNEHKNYGISQVDMYQMYAYSKKYKTSEIWLLYPINNEMKDHQDISFDSEDGTKINIFFVDVANIEESLNKLKIKISDR